MPKINLEKELYLKNRELYIAQKKSQKLIYNISECIFVLDSKFKVTLANKKSEIFFGKNQDLIGKKIDSLLFLVDKNNKVIPIKNFINSTNTNLNGLKQEIDGKDFYFNLRISVITSDTPGNEEYVLTLTDVTPEKKSEISKDDFITITSHELRTPMTIIKAIFGLCKKKKPAL